MWEANLVLEDLVQQRRLVARAKEAAKAGGFLEGGDLPPKVWKNNAQFGELTAEEVRTILKDDRLYAPSEVEDTFSALLKWISANKAARKGYLAKFLPLLRLGHCSVSDLEKVAVNREVQQDADALKVLNAIHRSLTSNSTAVGEVAGVDLSHRTWLKPRIPKNAIFVFGGWTEFATNRLLTYNCRASKWRDLGYQYTPRRAYHGLAAAGQFVFVVGGFSGRDCHNSLVCLDVGQARWIAKANMALARCYLSVSVLQGYIYAMGGYDGIDRMSTVERYNFNANCWTQVANMNDVRSDASAAVACGRIYIAGGFTGRAVLDTVEFYDPSTDLWTQVKSLPWKRSGHKMLAHNDIIYILGGFNGTTRVNILTQYDVRADRFTNLPTMPQAKSNFAAVVLEGCIYTIGGYDGTAVVQNVEKYDITSRKWSRAAQISEKCSAAAACVVEDVVNQAVAKTAVAKAPMLEARIGASATTSGRSPH
nr:kelch-like protein 10 [Rhipicephalus microplus]